MAVTLRFQSTGSVPGNARPVSMRGGSLTVGRGPDNDLVLPDPDKVISKRHCAIEEQNGSFVLIDLSANGTFLNYDKVPVGTKPARLHDGDILTLGAYELLVEVSAAPADDLAPLARPAAAPRHDPRDGIGQDIDDILGSPGAPADFLDDLLGGAPLKGPASVSRPELGEDGLMPPLGEDEDDLLAPREPDPARGASVSDHGAAAQDHFRPSAAHNVIPADWDGDFLEGEPLAPPDTSAAFDDFAAPPFASPAPDTAADPARPVAEEAAPVVAARTAAPPPVQVTSDAARAFLAALGQGRLDVPDAELEETMARLGGVMRTMIEGLREILMTRAAIKSEFRIQSTIIGASGNNPLKFSASPEQAIEAMVRPRLPGYLQAAEAARQALGDIKAHEVATVTGMEAALQGVLQQLAPEALEGQIRTRGGFADMLKSRKTLYWEAYERLYAQISDQAEKEFHDVFGREFARAYQAQLEKLK